MNTNLHLFDLYWEDILVTRVLPFLSLRECFILRCVSKKCLQIVDMYFCNMKSLKLMNKGFSPRTFKVSLAWAFMKPQVFFH